MSMAKLFIMLINANEVNPWVEKMWEIYQKSYQLPKSFFLNQIKDNSQHQALYFDNGKLVGFMSVFLQRKIKISHTFYTLIGFGQTTILPEYRHYPLISNMVFQLFWKEKTRYPLRKICFWTLASTYNTYLIFSQHLKHFYPQNTTQTPPEMLQIMDYIGKQYFSHAQLRPLPNTGFISFGYGKEYAIDEKAKITESDLANPHIRFYAEKLAEARQKYQDENLMMLAVAPANFSNFLHYLLKRIKIIS